MLQVVQRGRCSCSRACMGSREGCQKSTLFSATDHQTTGQTTPLRGPAVAIAGNERRPLASGLLLLAALPFLSARAHVRPRQPSSPYHASSSGRDRWPLTRVQPKRRASPSPVQRTTGLEACWHGASTLTSRHFHASGRTDDILVGHCDIPRALRSIAMATTEDIPSTTAPLLEFDDIVRKAELHERRLTELKIATATYLRRDARLGQLRERTLLLRSRAKWAWTNCHNYRGFVKESQGKFNEQAAAALTSGSVEGFTDRLEKLQACHEQVLRDFEEQNKLAESANDLQTELGILEYDLQKREDSTKEAAQSMKRLLDDLVLPGHSGAATAIETEVPPSPSLAGSEPLPSLVELYFRLTGNVRDAREQQMEVEEDFREARAERDFKSEHEQDLDTSDEKFEELWKQRRNQAARDLREATRQADSALDTCLNDGIDPEKYRRAARVYSDRSSSDLAGDTISRVIPQIDLRDIGDADLSDSGQQPIPVFTTDRARADVSDALPALTEAQAQPPLEDRVLNWIHDQVDSAASGQYFDVLEPQGHQASIRRPASFPSKHSQISKPQLSPHQYPTDAAPAVQPEQLLHPNMNLQPQLVEGDLQRRRSSDSNMAAMLPSHNPTMDFMDALRRFSGRRA